MNNSNEETKCDEILRKIGFSNELKRTKYREYLSNNFKKSHLRQAENSNQYDTYSRETDWSEIFKELRKELEIKRNYSAIKLKNDINAVKILATDLANFNFCRASYSIHKSFEIEYPSNENKTEIGNKFHEQLRLLDKLPHPYISDEKDLYELGILESKTISKIKNCELIFAGHKDNSQVFVNDEFNFAGVPDYIFKDPNGNHFVVEEKFHYLLSTNYERYKVLSLNRNNRAYFIENYDKNKESKIEEKIKKRVSIFYSNHIVQILSYLKFIKEYDIKYGVLLYWFYDHSGNEDFQGEFPKIHHYSNKVYYKNRDLNILETTFDQLTNLMKNKRINFSTDINPYKCAGCVVNKYCAHKTDKYNEVLLPYNRDLLKL